jgi:DNA-binding transcriptional ArsR family regulator
MTVRLYKTDQLVNRLVLYTMATDTLSLTFSALADPTRRAILARLAHGTATVKELSAPFAMSGPAISKHLRVLERAGLIARGREAQWRPCRLEAAPLEEVAEWAEHYRRFWDASYERLDDYLRNLQEKEIDDDDRP